MPVPVPLRIGALPKDKQGRIIPWFVAVINGQPDYRVVHPAALERALRHKLCWVCGMKMLRLENKAFIAAPVCSVTRVATQPPCHRECAIYSVVNCPVFSAPDSGVTLVWVTGDRSWRAIPSHGDLLFHVGDPVEALWFTQGRKASAGEILTALNISPTPPTVERTPAHA